MDKNEKRGIVALGQVMDTPKVRTDINPFWVNSSDGQELKARVAMRYIEAPNLPLWIDKTSTGEFLRTLSVAKSQGGTVFHVSSKQWQRIIELVGEDIFPTREEIETMEKLRHRSKHSSGQGFGLNTKERKVVETRAMVLASRYLKKYWDVVTDVSSIASYAFLCRRGKEEIRVEVKGTTGSGEKVILTKNEVKEANKSGYVLFLVTEIQLDSGVKGNPKTEGGVCTIFTPWEIVLNEMEPISFACKIDWRKGKEVKI